MQLAEQNRLLGSKGGKHTASPNSEKKKKEKNPTAHSVPALKDTVGHLQMLYNYISYLAAGY